MTLNELTAKYKKFAELGGPLHGLFEVQEVDAINYRVDGLADADGHPFCIGPAHVQYASERCGGILGDQAVSAHPCAMLLGRNGNRGLCGRPYSAHTFEKALFVLLVRDLENKEASSALFAIKEEMEKDGIAGVALPNLNKPFKIHKPKED